MPFKWRFRQQNKKTSTFFSDSVSILEKKLFIVYGSSYKKILLPNFILRGRKE